MESQAAALASAVGIAAVASATASASHAEFGLLRQHRRHTSFVTVLGSTGRWGLPKDTIAALWCPHADRALDWIRDYGDKDSVGV